MTDDDCSAEETDDPLYADRRNFYKVENLEQGRAARQGAPHRQASAAHPLMSTVCGNAREVSIARFRHALKELDRCATVTYAVSRGALEQDFPRTSQGPNSLRITLQVLPAAVSFSQNLSSGARSSSAMAMI